MENKALIRHLLGPGAALILSAVLVLTLLLLISAAEHAEVTSEFFSLLLAVNVLGIVILLVLIIGNFWRLLRQFRQRVLGSRLTLRMVGMFVLLVALPLSVVYYFSTQFLSKGVDSWFDVRVEQAIDDALLLGRTTLEAIKQEAVEEVVDNATRLSEASSMLETIQLLDELRESGGYVELSLYTQNGRIVASSSQDSEALIPDTPDEAVLAQIRQNQEYVALEPRSGGAQQLRIAVPVYSRDMGEPARALQALKLLPLRYAKLADSVESASAQYKQMVFARGPLKFSLILTLSLVSLVAMLLAVWAAIFIARRMVAPLKDLAAGTRAVAEGDYRKKLPVASNDELGVLVESFNDMTREINKAQNSARRSQREAEEQRTYLETVVGHLSSGVLSFDRHYRLMTQNAAATQALGVDIGGVKGRTVEEIRQDNPRFEPLLTAIEDSMRQDLAEWQAEVDIFGARGRQVLIVRGTKLTGKGARRGGYVIVFDDVTDLIQAQRDAAWGEVARRLAHEIKNPLTPIQLSAERIRRKYLDTLAPDQRSTLDRATRTIAQQVESMKGMVNAFSSYAQPVSIELKDINLNQLVQDVVEMHRQDERPIKLDFELALSLPPFRADAGRLRQVLNNLIINAHDALAETADPKITLCTNTNRDSGDAFIELKVADNGKGIPQELLDRLFEPYVTTKEKGTGLGLAIVKRIVEEHGGVIWAENLKPRGACITMRFPAQKQRGNNNVTDLNIKRAGIRKTGDGIA